jgi:hypothetical protein
MTTAIEVKKSELESAQAKAQHRLVHRALVNLAKSAQKATNDADAYYRLTFSAVEGALGAEYDARTLAAIQLSPADLIAFLAWLDSGARR